MTQLLRSPIRRSLVCLVAAAVVGAWSAAPADALGTDTEAEHQPSEAAPDSIVEPEASGGFQRVSLAQGGANLPGESVGGVDTDSAGAFVVFTQRQAGIERILIKDRRSGAVIFVTPTANGNSTGPSITDNGNVVAFTSEADNLVPGDTNGKTDVFRYDRPSGIISRVSVSKSGQQSNGHSFAAQIAGNGSRILFLSAATNLSPKDADPHRDLYSRYYGSGSTGLDTVLISESTAGTGGNQDSFPGTIDAQGIFVSFISNATNLAGAGGPGLYVRDLRTKRMGRLPMLTTTVQCPGGPSQVKDRLLIHTPRISRLGASVMFVVARPTCSGGARVNSEVILLGRTYDTSRTEVARFDTVPGSCLTNTFGGVMEIGGGYFTSARYVYTSSRNDCGTSTEHTLWAWRGGDTVRHSIVTCIGPVNTTTCAPVQGLAIDSSSSAAVFNTVRPLVTTDTNGVSDVYRYLFTP